MAEAAKFLFERDFSVSRSKTEAPEKPKPRFTDDDLAAARAQARQAGVAEGLEQARHGIEAQVQHAMEAAATALNALQQRHDARVGEIRGAAARLACDIARKLAGGLVAEQPMAEIECLVGDCLAQMPTEPRIVVRVADALLDELKARIDPLRQRSAYSGEVVLIGEPEMAPGDVRVEWADGGAERDHAALEQDIAAIVERFVEAQRGDDDPQTRFDFDDMPAPAAPAAEA